MSNWVLGRLALLSLDHVRSIVHSRSAGRQTRVHPRESWQVRHEGGSQSGTFLLDHKGRLLSTTGGKLAARQEFSRVLQFCPCFFESPGCRGGPGLLLGPCILAHLGAKQLGSEVFDARKMMLRSADGRLTQGVADLDSGLWVTASSQSLEATAAAPWRTHIDRWSLRVEATSST